VSVRILIGDCLERMSELEPDSIDSCVTDPPYHLTSIVKRFSRSNLEQSADKDLTKVKAGQYRRLAKGFMGQKWDGGDVAFRPETWAAVFRVLKPGAHLVAFSGTRTYHRMVCAIEDAGFEIRDQLAWVYGSGFPKSHNQPGGWGTALKPAWEPICLARKPLVGTVANNIVAHGTGALNIDRCRIAHQTINGGNLADNPHLRGGKTRAAPVATTFGREGDETPLTDQLGRWPANFIHDGSDEVLAGFPETQTNANTAGTGSCDGTSQTTYGQWAPRPARGQASESGSAARFFYCAKATSAERGEGNNHPTVKPVALMRWLCRLVTPKGGTVLDPFAGSGSTLIAADAEAFHAVGCELSPDYAAIAERRVRAAAGMFAEVLAA
jgi:site-specific DNA-methyltransferase (adenine-specific)